MQSEKVDKIFSYLRELFGESPKCELSYSNDLELLVAIILSAQCTDKRVNIVTKELFSRYKTVADFANADRAELEKLIYSTGFYRNKAKNIIALCKILDERKVTPRDFTDVNDLAKLSGIGRKTASVFIAEYHKKPALAVDTHVMRVAKRLGLTYNTCPVKIEHDLAKILAREYWASYHLYMVLFGRYFCTAKNPKCSDCKLREFCANIKNVH